LSGARKEESSVAKSGYTSAEVKAGVFLTFCIAIFVAMLFVYGKASRAWRGREELRVVFTSVTSLRPDAPVRFNGVEVGRVKNIAIITLDERSRARLPRLGLDDLDHLPLTDTQRVELRRLAAPPPGAPQPSAEGLHGEILKQVADRTMIELTLEVLSPREKEVAVRRYRADDQVRITTTLLGDTSVEIASGSSAEAPPPDKFLLGVSGDFFSNLAKSVEQVKEILTNVSDVVGAQERESVRKALRRFDVITQRIENIVQFADKRLSGTWDKVDGLADAAQKDLGSITETILSLKPPLVKTLESAEAAVKDLQGRMGVLADEARAAVADVKGQTTPILDDLHYITQHSKDDFPMLIKNTKELAARLRLSADKLDGVLSTGDRLLKESYPDLRRLILALRMGGENFAEATDVIKRKPWLIMNPAKDTAFDKPQETVQKLEVAMRRFRELGAELAAVRRNLPGQPNKEQLDRLDFLVQELNVLTGVLEYAGDVTRRQVLPEFERKKGAFIANPEAENVPNK
jgi:phospholipid/cholesterol/gamma-HCH transport system substrate-binding protein